MEVAARVEVRQQRDGIGDRRGGGEDAVGARPARVRLELRLQRRGILFGAGHPQRIGRYAATPRAAAPGNASPAATGATK